MKRFWQFLIVMLFAFAIVGCGGGGGGDDTGGDQPGETPHTHQYVNGVCDCGAKEPASNLTCAEDPTQAKCSDPATWDWNYNRFGYDGKGAIIKLLHGAPEEVDPENTGFTGSRKEEKQLQLFDIEQAYKIDLVIEKFPDAAAWGPDRVAWINGLAETNTTDKGDIFAISSDWVPSLAEGKSIAVLETIKVNSSTKQYDQKGGIFTQLNYTQPQEKLKQYRVSSNVYGYSNGESHADFFLYYNQDLVNDYQLEDPATLWNNGEWDWAKFMEYLRTAQAAFGAAETSGMYAFGGWVNEVARGVLAARGGKFVDLEAEQVLFKNQTVVNMYEDLRQIKREGMWASATGDVCPGFTAGTQLFQPAQLWFLSSTQRFASADPNSPTCDFDISVVPYPTATGDGMNKASYTIPMGSDSGYAIRNIASAESGLTAEVLVNIIDDFSRGLRPEFSAEDMTDEEAYRLFLKKRITSEQSIEAIMSVENNLSKYGYTDYLDVVSKSLGNGSDWQGAGFYTWGLKLLDLEQDVAQILSSYHEQYQNKLKELIA
ncbi:MAG: hypothetical protein IKC22_02450 [Bacilli bacterium]|nr:hypothetical protein [Bacilli bacterium]